MSPRLAVVVLSALCFGCATPPPLAPLRPMPGELGYRELGYRVGRDGVWVRQSTIAGYETLDCVIGLAPDAPLPETLPLIISLHGRGGTPEVPSGLYLDLHHPFRMVLPRGPHALETGGYAWLTVRTIEGRTDILTRDAVEQADALVRWFHEVRDSEPRPGRVIVLGFSQGGILTFTLAARHGELFDVALPMAGWLPPTLRPTELPAHAPPIFAMHGTADAAIPIELAEQSVVALREAGFYVDLQRYPGVGHTLSDPEELLLRRRLDGLLSPAPY